MAEIALDKKSTLVGKLILLVWILALKIYHWWELEGQVKITILIFCTLHSLFLSFTNKHAYHHDIIIFEKMTLDQCRVQLCGMEEGGTQLIMMPLILTESYHRYLI